MTTRNSFKPGGTLLASVMAMMGVHVLMLFVSLGSSAMQYELLTRAAAGAEISEEEATSNDQREVTIGMAQIGVFFVLAVLFLSALYRANANAHALGATDLSFTPGWTVGWFFVPFLNLFKPYLAIRDTWKASDPSHRDWKQNRASALVPIWWALYLLSIVIDRVSFAVTAGATSIPQLMNSTLVMMVSLVVELVLAGVAITLLYRLFAMQTERLAITGDERQRCPACGEAQLNSADRCPVCGEELGAALYPA